METHRPIIITERFSGKSENLVAMKIDFPSSRFALVTMVIDKKKFLGNVRKMCAKHAYISRRKKRENRQTEIESLLVGTVIIFILNVITFIRLVIIFRFFSFFSSSDFECTEIHFIFSL